MAADPPSPTRRRRLTKLLAAQIQRQRSSSSGNSSNSSIGSDPLQDYQHKLEQALFDAEHNLQVGRHQRLCPPPPPPSSLSLHYQQQHHFHHLNNSLDDDDNSLVETASVGSATASFMDSRSDDATRGIIYTPKQQQPLNFQHAGTLSPADIMRKNLIDRDRSGSPSSTVDVFQNTFDEEDYDTATNLDGTVTSGYTSTCVSEYTRDTNTEYTRDTFTEFTAIVERPWMCASPGFQRESTTADDEETMTEKNLYTNDDVSTYKPRVRFDLDTKFENDTFMSGMAATTTMKQLLIMPMMSRWIH